MYKLEKISNLLMKIGVGLLIVSSILFGFGIGCLFQM